MKKENDAKSGFTRRNFIKTAGGAAAVAGPVSYTHLTLPTIYTV